eukprot:7355126-Pyramimonas_sp.AAC.1
MSVSPPSGGLNDTAASRMYGWHTGGGPLGHTLSEILAGSPFMYTPMSRFRSSKPRKQRCRSARSSENSRYSDISVGATFTTSVIAGAPYTPMWVTPDCGPLLARCRIPSDLIYKNNFTYHVPVACPRGVEPSTLGHSRGA